MFKNKYFNLGLIIGIFLLSLLAALPRIPIVIDNDYISIDTHIGGYYLRLFGGQTVLDLRDYRKGLDLEGGVRVVLGANMGGVDPQDREGAMESLREIIERRVNFFGVAEPYIVTSRVGDDYRIIVELPGIEDITSAVDLIGQTAQLKFMQLKPEYEWNDELYLDYFSNRDVWEETAVTGGDLRNVSVEFPQGGTTLGMSPEIVLRFTPSGRTKFEQLAKDNVNKPIAIFLDDEEVPLSMPVVNPELAQGLFTDPVISGQFDVETANNLSIQMRAGALPVPVEVLQQENIDATLGAASVRRSFQAGLVGLVLILIYMAVVYGKMGLLANFALIIYGLIVLSLFKLIPVVLTLPGIAGFLLSLGMAVDANILIFERIREEISWGRPKSLAVKLGFARAWSSIRDSNLSSLLTAFILFYFGSGSIRGFAFTLSIGIMVSLFTAIFVTRNFIDVFGLSDDSKLIDKIKVKFFKKKYANN